MKDETRIELPAGDGKTETDLMRLLESGVLIFMDQAMCADDGVKRAVDWLHAKYGSAK
jgi:hypothetical protein